MVLLYIISKIGQKKRKQRVALISECLLDFRKRKQNGEVDTSKVLFEVDTDYDKNGIEYDHSVLPDNLGCEECEVD